MYMSENRGIDVGGYHNHAGDMSPESSGRRQFQAFRTPASSCDGVGAGLASEAVGSDSAWVLLPLPARNPGNAFLRPDKKPPPWAGSTVAGEEGAGLGLDLWRPGTEELPSLVCELPVARRLLCLLWSIRLSPNKAGRGLPGRFIRLLLRELPVSVTWMTPVVPSAPSVACGRGLGV
jgi:hypothetical protein